MCGIAGIVSKLQTGELRQQIRAMSQAIRHRGPDGEGFVFLSGEAATPAWSVDTPQQIRSERKFAYMPQTALEAIEDRYQIALAHRRLAIIDLSEAGHQPMCDTRQDYWITFNGEIYNYRELKEELQAKGHVFVTHTDTEVILASYREWGAACLNRFNGMFAFCLYDRQSNELFCARDRVGVKPFYYVSTDSHFAFSSEYKAFVRAGLVKFEVNEVQQFEFIVNANLEHEDESLFRHIKELKPSHYLVYKLHTHELAISRYYHLPDRTVDRPEQETIAQVEKALINAVSLRLRSDVEVGSCLSGGLDSSIIAGLVKNLQPDRQMQLFTAVFRSEAFDESSYARQVADHVGGRWQTVSPTGDEFFRDVRELNYYQDLPVWSSSTYSQHRVMKLAAEHGIKVVLDGQGADELFGGYAHHYLALWRESSWTERLRLMREARPTVQDPYLLYLKQEVKDLFQVSNNYSGYFSPQNQAFAKARHEPFADHLNGELRKDYYGRLKSFLKCEDRCSMAFGIESRVPFADDVPLVDLAFSIEGRLKIRHGISKYLLREAAKSYIPHAIYARRDKIGFETPLVKWMAAHKARILEEIRKEAGFIQYEAIQRDFDRLLLQKPGFLLRLFSFSVWKSVFAS